MELYNNPANRFVAGFLGSPAMNFFPAELIGGTRGEVTGVRPEHLRIAETGRLRGTVVHVEKLGGDTNVLFGQYDITPEATIALDFDDAHAFRFDKDGNRL